VSGQRASILRTFKAVAWSFFGVRKASEHEKDLAQLDPKVVIVAGVIVAALFVLGLVTLVKWVVGSGVAG
jgi:preprotein translocase subunit Sec61beta